MTNDRDNKNYIAECPIEHFSNFINLHGLSYLKRICSDSTDSIIYINYNEHVSKEVGYIIEVEYVYSEKLENSCLRFYCKLNKNIHPKAFSIRLILGTLVLIIDEKDI